MDPINQDRESLLARNGLEGDIDDINAELIRRHKSGDASAVELLAIANIPLVQHMAKQYLWEHIGNSKYHIIDDLNQAGYIGLLKALKRIDKYNPENKLSTFLRWKVVAEFQKYMIEKDFIKKPSHHPTILRAERRFVGIYIAEHGQEPSDEQVADYLNKISGNSNQNITAERLRELRKIHFETNTFSLDYQLESGDAETVNLVKERTINPIVEDMSKDKLYSATLEHIAKLPERYQKTVFAKAHSDILSSELASLWNVTRTTITNRNRTVRQLIQEKHPELKEVYHEVYG